METVYFATPATNEEELEHMSKELEHIRASLARLEAAVARIEDAIAGTQRSCANMDAHISFVESVYVSVRQPLSFLAGRLRGARPLPLRHSQGGGDGQPTGDRHVGEEPVILERGPNLEHERRENGENEQRGESDAP